jgi:putative membrane protein
LARKYIILLLVNLLGLILADRWLDGVRMDGYAWGLLAAALLTLLHMVLKPVLLFFTLPMTVLSLGLSLLAINALLFWLAGNLLAGFTVTGLSGALGGALLISLLGSVANIFVLPRPAARPARVFTFYRGANPYFGKRPDPESRAPREPHSASRPWPDQPAREEGGAVIDMENDETGQWKVKDPSEKS